MPLAQNRRDIQGKPRIYRIGGCRRVHDARREPFTVCISTSSETIGRAAFVFTNSWRRSLRSTTGRCVRINMRWAIVLPQQKYGHVAFDSTQKAVLTSCVLRYKPLINTSSERKKLGGEDTPSEEGFVNCCFSFTIRRDKWGIPSMIVGNFIKC